MASPPPPATWSVTACLRYRGWLEIHAAAENVLPGWGRGGERLSFLLRLRRRLRLAVTSQCGRALASTEPSKIRALSPTEPKKPRALKLLRFLRSRLARVPRVPSVWRRKKPPPPTRAAADANPGSRTQAILSLLKTRALLMPPATTTVLCFVAALAVAAASVAALRLMISNASCTSWRCVLAKKSVKFLGPLYEWLGLPKLSLKWLFSM